MEPLSGKKLVVYILILALGLRLISLNQSLWMDEAISGTVVKNFSLGEIVSKFILSDTHPPLYYLILRIWTAFFGYSEISLRLPSVIFGVLTVYIVYLLGKIYSQKVGFYASVLMALAPLHIYYSQEARMYSLTTFLSILTVYLFLKSKWLFFSLSLLFLGMSDYLPLLILIPCWVFVILFERNQKTLPSFLKSQLPLLLFLAFWSPVFLKQTISTTNYLVAFPEWGSVLGTPTPKQAALVWVKFIVGRVSFDDKTVYFGVVLLISFLLAGVFIKSLSFNKKVFFLWFWLILPVLVFFTISFFTPGFNYFRLLFVLPAFYFLISVGLANLKKTYIFILIASINLTFSLYYLLNPSFWREDWKGAVPFIESKLKGDEGVVVSYSEPFTPYIWYAEEKNRIFTFNSTAFEGKKGLYTLDYLMDLTDPNRKNYQKLVNLGFRQENVYNFRGVGQIRYWVKPQSI